MSDQANMDNDNERLKMERANVLTQVINQNVTAGFRGLTLVNAGGAAALAAFVQAVWGKASASSLLPWLLHGVLWLLAGTTLASVGFVTRYLGFFNKNTHTPKLNPWWWAELTVIILSACFFIVGMLTAVFGALYTARCMQ